MSKPDTLPELRFFLVATIVIAAVLASPSVRAGSWLLIGGGGPAEADGQKAVNAAKEALAQQSGLVDLADGYPIVLHSDEVRGLNKGSYVALLGACATKAAAEDALVPLAKAVQGVTLHDAAQILPVTCPVRLAKKIPNRQPTECRQTIAVPGHANLALQVCVPPEGGCPSDDSFRIELQVSGSQIGAVTFLDECGERDWNGKPLAIKTRSHGLAEQFAGEGVPMLVVGETVEQDGEHGSTTHYLIRWCGGSFSMTEAFSCGWGAARGCKVTGSVEGDILTLSATNSGSPDATYRFRVSGCSLEPLPQPPAPRAPP